MALDPRTCVHIPLKHSGEHCLLKNLCTRIWLLLKNYVVCCASLSIRKFQVDFLVIAIFVHGTADMAISVGQKWLNGFLIFTVIEFQNYFLCLRLDFKFLLFKKYKNSI